MGNVNKAIFIDRDGVINKQQLGGYIDTPQKFELYPATIPALKRIQDVGYTIFVITNQGMVGEGVYTKETVEEIHRVLTGQLLAADISVDIRYCPHARNKGCDCRKPKTGLIKKIIQEYPDIDLSQSYVIGDKTSDIQLGKNLKVKTILVKTGEAGNDGRFKVKPDHIVADLAAAADVVTTKRVAVVLLSMEVNGAAKTAFPMIEGLNEIGIVPDLYLMQPGTSGIEKEYPNARFKLIEFPYKKWSILTLFQTVDISGKFPYAKYDFTYDFTGCLPLKGYPKNALFYVYCPHSLSLSQQEYSTPIHKAYAAFYRRWKQRLEKLAYRKQLKYTVFDKAMQDVMKEYTGVEMPIISYPPVEVKKFYKDADIRSHNRSGVVSLSRFARCKRQLEVVKLAGQFPERPFRIIGGVSEPEYYEEVRNYVKKHHLSNVKLYPDAPLSQVITLCQQSQYFVHLMENEHFGLVTAEAIAAGCVPLVHNSWGSKEIVTPESLRFESIDELPNKIHWLDSEVGDDALSWMMGDLQRDVWQYDTSVFKKGMLKAGGLI